MSEQLSCPDMTVTHDGVIFPRPRPEMIDPEAIGLRMAGDMAARIRAAQYLDLADLTKNGWTNDQIELHWANAFALKGAPLPPMDSLLNATVGPHHEEPHAVDKIVAQPLDDLPVATAEASNARRIFHLAPQCLRNTERGRSVPSENFVHSDDEQVDQHFGGSGGVFECGQFHWDGSRWAGCLNFDPTDPCVKSSHTTTLGREIVEQTATVIAMAVFLGVLFVAMGA